MILVGFSGGTDMGLFCIAVYVTVQTLDSNVIIPMVAKKTVDLAPALVLGAQLIFGVMFGILGLALLIFGIMYILMLDKFRQRFGGVAVVVDDQSMRHADRRPARRRRIKRPGIRFRSPIPAATCGRSKTSNGRPSASPSRIIAGRCPRWRGG